ncbi:hypothetical protein K525DRAFT_274785 [Schizophyllum commune Loenen D]|nr:hypothetical protein K525DRAFT_274785 [Schizophyllum commune Loenen D]
MNQRRTWRDSDQQASWGPSTSAGAPQAASTPEQRALASASQQRTGAQDAVGECAFATQQHARASTSQQRITTPREPTGRCTESQQRLAAAQERVATYISATFLAPIVWAHFAGADFPDTGGCAERRSSRATPPPIANGPLRAHPETYQTNDALHGDEVQPGPSTSTANRSDPTAMFSTPPPGWTGQTTPEQPQNASAPRFVPAHPSMAPIGELIAAELGAIWERTEKHGRAHEFGSSVRARERSRRSHATTQAALAPQGLATSPPHHSEEAGEEEEEAVVEEGDDFAADNE